MNSTDPLANFGPLSQRALFDQFNRFASQGFSREDVIGAAVNIIINAVRQTCQTRAQAEVNFDEIFGKTKNILMNHYDSTGRKKGIFPYNQVIDVDINDPEIFKNAKKK